MSEKTETEGSFRDVLHAIGSAFFEKMQPRQESMKIMQKHLLQAHAEVLKGCLAVIEHELDHLEKKNRPAPARQKINIK